MKQVTFILTSRFICMQNKVNITQKQCFGFCRLIRSVLKVKKGNNLDFKMKNVLNFEYFTIL